MLSTLISSLLTGEVGCELNHEEEQDREGTTGKDLCLAVECRVGWRWGVHII